MAIQQTVFRQAVLAAIWQLAGGYPDPDDPDPPGPWDSIIRRALQQSVWLFGPRADPWRQHSPFGAQTDPSIEADALPHPHLPLPPRAMVFAAIAQEVADLALLMQEVADAILAQGKRRRMIIIETYIAKFVEEFCASGFRMPRPLPLRCLWWLPEEISGLDLAVAGV